jgi:hypothetical protein
VSEVGLEMDPASQTILEQLNVLSAGKDELAAGQNELVTYLEMLRKNINAIQDKSAAENNTVCNIKSSKHTRLLEMFCHWLL